MGDAVVKVADLAQVRENAEKAKAREALAAKAVWSPREAAVAFIADIDAGVIDPECAVMFYAEPEPAPDGEPKSTRTGRYCGATSPHGQRETFWVIGMVSSALSDWIGSHRRG